VIRQLPLELRDPVCIFYLVLRGLDTIEDDSDFQQGEKLPLLRNFYTKNREENWKITGVGDTADYRALLSHYYKVSRSFQRLDEKYQDVIIDICKQMGEGMADFSEKNVVSVADYDLYCHYVAGLVGMGLTQLFVQSGAEGTEINGRPDLANSMGLFLQKTNITRDYHEDLHFGRSFWPKEIWGLYATELSVFEHIPDSKVALACLNHMVTDAMQHAADSLKYLSQLKNKAVFRFCAIPQVMAIATLAKIYNNPEVFTGVVKIRKGLTAKLIMDINDFETLQLHFNRFVSDLITRLDTQDPNYEIMHERLLQILEIDTPKAVKA